MFQKYVMKQKEWETLPDEYAFDPSPIKWYQMTGVVPDPVDWVIEGVIPAGKLTVLAGETRIGTSLMAMELVARVTRGDRVTHAGMAPAAGLDLSALQDSALRGNLPGLPQSRSVPATPNPAMPTAATPTQKSGDWQLIDGINQWVCDHSPQQASSAQSGAVMLFTKIADLADTIRPRLDAAGADMPQVYAFGGTVDLDDHTGQAPLRSFSLNDDLADLETEFERLEREGVPVRMVMIDPIEDLLTSLKNVEEVQRMAERLAALAARSGAAIVVVSRLPLRGKDPAALLREPRLSPACRNVLTSSAQAVWQVVRDPNSADRRFLAPIKANFDQPSPVLGFLISNNCVQWDKYAVSLTGDTSRIFGKPSQLAGVLDDRSELGRAVAWLSHRLKEEAVPSNLVKEEASEKFFSLATLRRAYHWLRADAKKEHGSGRWVWHLAGSGDGTEPRPVAGTELETHAPQGAQLAQTNSNIPNEHVPLAQTQLEKDLPSNTSTGSKTQTQQDAQLAQTNSDTGRKHHRVRPSAAKGLEHAQVWRAGAFRTQDLKDLERLNIGPEIQGRMTPKQIRKLLNRNRRSGALR